MMCCNCRSLGPANYQIEVEVGSLGLLYFGNNQRLDCHCFDSVSPVNRAMVMRRYEVGDDVTIILLVYYKHSIA